MVSEDQKDRCVGMDPKAIPWDWRGRKRTVGQGQWELKSNKIFKIIYSSTYKM